MRRMGVTASTKSSYPLDIKEPYSPALNIFRTMWVTTREANPPPGERQKETRFITVRNKRRYVLNSDCNMMVHTFLEDVWYRTIEALCEAAWSPKWAQRFRSEKNRQNTDDFTLREFFFILFCWMFTAFRPFFSNFYWQIFSCYAMLLFYHYILLYVGKFSIVSSAFYLFKQI